MIKIGIITQYYNSNNYGGLLQAYALCNVISAFGTQYDAEQISYDVTLDCAPRIKVGLLSKIFHTKIIDLFAIFKRKVHRFYKDIVTNDSKKSCAVFRKEYIPHSINTYNSNCINTAKMKYDIFLTGSDQVWNPKWFIPAYFLTFASDERVKIAYAASLGTDRLTECEKERLRIGITDYKAISLRESSAVELVSALTNLPVVQVLDPVLLLNSNEWDKICAESIVHEDYIFCYFLGNNYEERTIAKSFARKLNKKLVSIPFLTNEFRRCDIGFSDKSLVGIGPREFISLIKYADYVFTDSFHATAFSAIYNKECFTFDRVEFPEMNVRIKEITSLVGSEDHYCNTQDRISLDYICNVKPINYEYANNRLNYERTRSIGWLRHAIVSKD